MNHILLYIDTVFIALAGVFKSLKAYATAKALASMRSRVRAATKDMMDGSGIGNIGNGAGIDSGSGSGSSSSGGSSHGSTGP